MYREENEKQLKLEDFYMPFGGHLNEETRWVILSNKVPYPGTSIILPLLCGYFILLLRIYEVGK